MPSGTVRSEQDHVLDVGLDPVLVVADDGAPRRVDRDAGAAVGGPRRAWRGRRPPPRRAGSAPQRISSPQLSTRSFSNGTPAPSAMPAELVDVLRQVVLGVRAGAAARVPRLPRTACRRATRCAPRSRRPSAGSARAPPRRPGARSRGACRAPRSGAATSAGPVSPRSPPQVDAESGCTETIVDRGPRVPSTDRHPRSRHADVQTLACRASPRSSGSRPPCPARG